MIGEHDSRIGKSFSLSDNNRWCKIIDVTSEKEHWFSDYVLEIDSPVGPESKFEYQVEKGLKGEIIHIIKIL
jgi:hypothetical protein